MNIEEEIFKGTKIIEDKLKEYGFKKNDDSYIFSKLILNDLFRIDVWIIKEKVKVKVYDLAFNEEYNNYRVLDMVGEFVHQVLDEVTRLLIDIKDKCTISNKFISKQANRISKLILNEYGDNPEFLWDKTPFCGVFRNNLNKKWYGLIMNIDINKLEESKGEKDILNVKLEPDKIKELLKRYGFYPAYHMNKKYWLSILLDDIISDEEIMGYIRESYEYTKNK